MYILNKINSTLKNERKPFKFIIGLVLYYTNLCKYLKIKRDGYILRFHKSSFSVWLWVYNDDDIFDEKIINLLPEAGDTYIDIWANIGNLTIVWSKKIWENGTCIAFEPHPKTFLFLKNNVALNNLNNVKLENFGLWDKEGLLHFSDSYSDDMNHITPDGSLEISVNKLDKYNFKDIKLLKIDVEWYEKYVFLWWTETLKRAKFIYFEYSMNNYQQFNYDFTDIYDLLLNLWFRIFRVDNEFNVEEINRDFSSNKNYVNLLATRQEDINNLTKTISTWR